MLFIKRDPPPELSDFVRQFWIVENDDPVPSQQKIVPDGYCEIIIHYGDPYRIRLYETWELQERTLISGQIRRFFFLENTGVSAMLGIKLQPDAIFALTGLDQMQLTDRVVPFQIVSKSSVPRSLGAMGIDPDERIDEAVNWVRSLFVKTTWKDPGRIRSIVRQIIANNGMIDIESVATEYEISRRHLEREFKKIVGLTPKFFARIIQFNYIFEALQSNDHSWVDVALDSGYFDQSHFIRNFKAFTGESPSQYGFDKRDMANFFLRKRDF